MNKTNSYNLKDFTGDVSLDELFELRGLVVNAIWEKSPSMDTSIEGDGFNIAFEFGGKRWFLRGEVDTREPLFREDVEIVDLTE